jgi:hypothetical protein
MLSRTVGQTVRRIQLSGEVALPDGQEHLICGSDSQKYVASRLRLARNFTPTAQKNDLKPLTKTAAF